MSPGSDESEGYVRSIHENIDAVSHSSSDRRNIGRRVSRGAAPSIDAWRSWEIRWVTEQIRKEPGQSDDTWVVEAQTGNLRSTDELGPSNLPEYFLGQGTVLTDGFHFISLEVLLDLGGFIATCGEGMPPVVMTRI
uniref:Uncharacterized protein n=1 Tax=Candidatus Kentrum sp. FW TaxID=2126338 RepID=A0A450T3M8_9GAMM|nr:MAG: hypothetical protein BECKFW1821B_GA0114236_106317 [Candidatus Kentron sp. FW]